MRLELTTTPRTTITPPPEGADVTRIAAERLVGKDELVQWVQQERS